jgi:hypothetical protein
MDATDERHAQLKSIMERNAIEEFLVNSELARKTVCIFRLFPVLFLMLTTLALV